MSAGKRPLSCSWMSRYPSRSATRNSRFCWVNQSRISSSLNSGAPKAASACSSISARIAGASSTVGLRISTVMPARRASRPPRSPGGRVPWPRARTSARRDVTRRACAPPPMGSSARCRRYREADGRQSGHARARKRRQREWRHRGRSRPEDEPPSEQDQRERACADRTTSGDIPAHWPRRVRLPASGGCDGRIVRSKSVHRRLTCPYAA
jgi:hypothetical protein